jgi:hypothetical protein
MLSNRWYLDFAYKEATMRFRSILIAVLVLSLTACGGGRKASTNAASPASSGAMGTAEPVPAMNCGGTQPVWVNERSRVFHLPGDPYYGRTKHGKYMCERDAAKAGYHPSKT